MAKSKTLSHVVSNTGPLSDGTISTSDVTGLDTAYQPTLVSGTNIKTVGGSSLLGAGDVSIGVSTFNTRTGAVTLSSSDVTTALGYTPYNSTNPSGYITSSASITGNAATATALQTARTINGVSFDGTANITVADSTKLPLSGGTLTGNLTVNTKIFAGGSTVNSGYNGVFATNQVGADSGGKLIYLFNDGTTIKLDAYNYATSSALSFNIGGNGGTVNLASGTTINNNIALHAGNYTSYSPTLTGTGASGTWGINITGESRSVNLGGAGTQYLASNVWAGGGGYPGYSFAGGNSRFGFSSSSGVIDVYADGNFYATDSSHLVLHAGNYSSYALPLSGGTVTGTLNVNDGNLQLYKAQTVDMSNTSVYSTSNFYPVLIGVPTSGCWIEIQNNLNSNVPSWSTHGSGFTLNLRWWTSGSGWGTTEVKRRVEQYHERFANTTICGGISQLGNSSQEVVWLRGGGQYYFRFSRNLIAYPQSSTYTLYGETASVVSSIVNSVWNSATGTHISYYNNVHAGTDIRAPIFYDSNDTGYYCDPNGTNRLNFVNSNNHYIQPGHMLYSDHGNWTGEYNKIQWHASHLYLQNAGGGYLLILRRGDGGERFYCDYNGNVTASGNITAYSDARLKTNVKTIQNARELRKKLRGVTFDWIESGEHSYGLIAQEVEAHIPELVLEVKECSTDPNSKTIKTVDYSKLVSVLIQDGNEQDEVIEQLEARVAKLEKLIEQLIS